MTPMPWTPPWPRAYSPHGAQSENSQNDNIDWDRYKEWQTLSRDKRQKAMDDYQRMGRLHAGTFPLKLRSRPARLSPIAPVVTAAISAFPFLARTGMHIASLLHGHYNRDKIEKIEKAWTNSQRTSRT